jgi:O-succinylbenzoic acid--CoA ligase
MGLSPDWPTRDLLAHRVVATPEATALQDAIDGRSWTYADLDAAVEANTAQFRSTIDSRPTSETRPRSRVGIAATTSPSFVTSLFAAWRSGAVAIPLSTERPADRLQDRLDRLDLDLWLDTGGDGLPSTADPGVPVFSTGLPAGTDGRSPTRSANTDFQGATWDPEETALILFTSGTTDRPKAVRLTHRNLVASATASGFRLGIDRADRWHCCLPVNHMGGLAPIVRSTLYGTTTVLEPGFDASRTTDLLAEHEATGISLVPTMLQRCIDGGWEPHDALRFVLLGGAPASRDLLEASERAGVPVYPTYGTTETASQIATATPSAAVAHPGTVGLPLVTASVTIIDPETGEPADAGDVGQIVVDGPVVTPGYLDAEAFESVVGPHGFHTGDLGSRDESGRLRIHGRLDDAIRTGGETVQPASVVDALSEHPAVADAAVVGLPDPEWGEQVASLVVPENGTSVEGAAVRRFAQERLAPYEVPKLVGVADELPRTASGTVDREAVRERLHDASHSSQTA